MSRYFANVTLFDGRTVRRSRACSSPAGRSSGWARTRARRASARGARSRRRPHPHARPDRLPRPPVLRRRCRLRGRGRRGSTPRWRPSRPRGTPAAPRAGVTTVRDLGGPARRCATSARAIDDGPRSAGPRVAGGRAGAHDHRRARPTARSPARSTAPTTSARPCVSRSGRRPRDQGHRHRRRAHARRRRDFTAFTPEELEAAVDEAHKWGRGVAAHAIGAEGIENAVRGRRRLGRARVQVSAAVARR